MAPEIPACCLLPSSVEQESFPIFPLKQNFPILVVPFLNQIYIKGEHDPPVRQHGLEQLQKKGHCFLCLMSLRSQREEGLKYNQRKHRKVSRNRWCSACYLGETVIETLVCPHPASTSPYLFPKDLNSSWKCACSRDFYNCQLRLAHRSDSGIPLFTSMGAKPSPETQIPN